MIQGVLPRRLRLKLDLRLLGRASFGTQQRVEDSIDLAAGLISTTQRGYHPLPSALDCVGSPCRQLF